MKDFLKDLEPEELDPRLELQLLIDPLALLQIADNNCRDGGNCNVSSGASV